MKYLKFLFFLVFLSSFWACSDYQIKEDPLSDYELFFTYLKNDYGYRNEKFNGLDLEGIRKKYLPEIEKNPTKKNLAKIFLKIEHQELRDPHVYFSGTEKPRDLVPEREVNSYVKEGADVFDPIYPKDPAKDRTNRRKLKEKINIIKETHFYIYGTVRELSGVKNSEIGYLYIKDFNKATGGSSSLAIPKGVDAVEDYLKDLKSKGVKKMIVDIRSDAGGSSYVPLWIAKRFADKKAVYMVAEYDTGNGFQEEKWYVEPEGKEGFREGKIALLTNGNTCSGGELFVLAMLQRKNIVHIGSATEGCAGNVVDKDLANGWNLRITNGKTAKADGSSYFKVGIIPKIIIKNTPLKREDVVKGEDLVIKKAIEELNK